MTIEWGKLYEASASGVGCSWAAAERNMSFKQEREAFILYYNCADVMKGQR